MIALLRRLCLATMVASFIIFSANALTITPNLATFESDETANLSAADVEDITGCDDLTELYKSEVDTGDEFGPFAGSYNTTYDNQPDDPADADVVHVAGQPSIAPQDDCLWLLVKDGSVGDPAQYLIDLSANGLNWNGSDTLELEGFWPQQGAISHIAIYGIVNGVPDGGLTIVLLGAAISAVGFISRRLKA